MDILTGPHKIITSVQIDEFDFSNNLHWDCDTSKQLCKQAVDMEIERYKRLLYSYFDIDDKCITELDINFMKRIKNKKGGKQ